MKTPEHNKYKLTYMFMLFSVFIPQYTSVYPSNLQYSPVYPSILPHILTKVRDAAFPPADTGQQFPVRDVVVSRRRDLTHLLKALPDLLIHTLTGTVKVDSDGAH